MQLARADYGVPRLTEDVLTGCTTIESILRCSVFRNPAVMSHGMCLCQNHHPGKSGTVETQLTTSEMKRTPPEVCKTSKIIEFGPIAKDIGEML